MKQLMAALLMALTLNPNAIMAKQRTVKLRVIETSDVHGSFFPYDFINRKPKAGSLARVSSYVDSLRQTYKDNLILLENGDILQGQPTCYYYNYIATKERNVAADVVNYLKYDAQTFGNHDVETGHAVYDKWIKELNCPVIGANIIDTKTQAPYVKPYIILNREGGRGGLGNFQFRTSTNQAPRYAQPGEPMQEMTIIMELKLLADVGLVGFPNAGKSTLLSAVSSARPKIANYPFTTLEPSLGIVDYRDHQSFVMADIPGIIEGASEGKGLGLRFLRHIERNSLLLFMVPGDTDDIKKEYEVLLGELKNFNPEMLDKHRVLAITKCDLLDEELIEMLKETLPTDLPVVFISSVTGQGIQELKDILWKELNSESNKLQEITAEDTLVHRDKDMSRFQQELADEGEDIVEYIDEDDIEDVEDLDDFEYE